MRSYPQGVRSVVLDSTVPAQSHLLLSVPGSTARVFNVLFQGCASDPTCNATYPHLDTTFYALVTQLNAQPVTFQTTDFNTSKQYTVLFNGDALVSVLFDAFYATPYIPYLPEMIHEANQGTYTHLVTLLYGALQFDDSVSWGDYYSVECAEDVARVTPAQVTTAAQAYPAAIRQDQLIGLEAELPGCQAWGVTPAPASEAQAVSSAIPTIILEDEYDPITPPANGALAAQTLSTSYQFQFPGTGHGAFLSTFTPGNCPATIVNAFWTSPTTKPDGSCTTTMPEPQFQ
jgi:pimeloyl-ACP methyl ester carboxylesterase